MKFGSAAARVITVWRGPGDLAEAHAIAARLWRVHVERGWRRRAALPLRWTATAD